MSNSSSNQFNKNDVIEKLTTPYSLWAYIAILPIVKPLTLLIANKTKFTPNQITFFSFILSIVSFFLFISGEPLLLVFGGVFFELSYVFDCIDGTIARLKQNGTYFGELWDHLTDRVKDNALFFAIVYGQYRISNEVDWLFYGFLIIFIYSLYYTRIIILDIIEYKHSINIGITKKNIKEQKQSALLGNNFKKNNLFKRWIDFAMKRKLTPNPAGPEIEALIFFIAPILTLVINPICIKICIIVGGLILILVIVLRTLYTAIVMKKIT